MFKKFFQKGQVLALYALILPLIFIFLGMAADFGWWYFNQSRLQNAADAAVLAGASQIVTDFKNVYDTSNPSVTFVNEVPSDATLQTVPNFDAETTGKVTETAEQYADKNFEYTNLKSATDFFKDAAYGDIATLHPMYYVVELKGQANHLFSIRENFGDMDIKAVAVAQIVDNGGGSGGGPGPNDPTPPPPPVVDKINEMKASTVIVGNWEVQNIYHNKKSQWNNNHGDDIYGEDLFDGKWNHFREPNKKIHDTLKINNGQITLREENLVIQDHNSGDSNVYATDANSNKKYNWYELESINLDFTQDMTISLTGAANGRLTEDWDICWNKSTTEISSVKVSHGGSIDTRTHSQFTFEAPYKTRPVDSTKQPKNYKKYQYDADNPARDYPDPLGVRIESEPMWYNLGVKDGQTELNTVRQIIININQSNMTEVDGDGNAIPDANGYTYRPLIIFYDGPETNAKNPNLSEAERLRTPTKRRRPSQPIILNLNADFSGILCAPNSPVVLQANGHKFKGLIFAQKYYSLKTEADVYVKDGRYFSDTSTTTEYFKYTTEAGLTMFLDSIGNVQYKAYKESAYNQNASSPYYQNIHRYGDIDTFGMLELKDLFFTVGDDAVDIEVQEWIEAHEGENLL